MSEYKTRALNALKLKDREGRRSVVIDLKRDFGFMPEKIIIEKAPRANNTFIVHAVYTEEMLKAKQAEQNKILNKIKDDQKKGQKTQRVDKSEKNNNKGGTS